MAVIKPSPDNKPTTSLPAVTRKRGSCQGLSLGRARSKEQSRSVHPTAPNTYITRCSNASLSHKDGKTTHPYKHGNSTNPQTSTARRCTKPASPLDESACGPFTRRIIADTTRHDTTPS